MKPDKADTPHPDDFMAVIIELDFRAKLNPDAVNPPPVIGGSFSVCLPAEDDTAEYLEDIAKAIRERRLYGFMVQDLAESPVGCGEWIEQGLDDILSAPKEPADAKS